MWINYYHMWVSSAWITEIGSFNFGCISTWEDGYIPPNECSMMIPGTYAQMHKDYD